MAKSGRGIASPFVEVEVIGAPLESRNKYKTKAIGRHLFFFFSIFLGEFW